MKQQYAGFFRKSQLSLLLCFTAIPPFLLLSPLLAPNSELVTWIIPLSYTVLAIISLLVPGKRRLLYGIGAVVLLLAIGAWLYTQLASFVFPVTAILFSVLLIVSLQFAGWEQDQELPSVCIWIGLALYIAGQAFISWAKYHGFTVLDRATPGFLLSFLCFAFLTLFSRRRDAMSIAGMWRYRPSRSVQKKNTLLILIFAVPVILLASAPAIIQAFETVFLYLRGLIIQILNFLQSFKDKPTKPTFTTAPTDETISDVFEPITPQAPNDFILVLQQIFHILALIVLCVGIPLAIVGIVTVMIRLIRKFAKRMGDFSAEASEDYFDEITSTRNDSHNASSGRQKRMRQSLSKRNLSPREQIRTRYQRLLRKHRTWSSSSTARENIPQSLAQLYEQARYTDAPVSQEEADRFHAGSKNL